MMHCGIEKGQNRCAVGYILPPFSIPQCIKYVTSGDILLLAKSLID